MKFVMIKEYDYNVSKDKVIIGEIKENDIGYYENGEPYKATLNHKISIAYLLNIGDFNVVLYDYQYPLFNREMSKEEFDRKVQENEFNIILNTYSIQIRPKAIYKNNKGYYKKVDNKRIYFNNEETIEIEKAIKKFKKYLKEGDNI